MTEPIGMEEMRSVFGVTDSLEISREKIEVPLLKQGQGTLRRLSNGKLEITLPSGQDARQWMVEMEKKISDIASDLLGTANPGE